jgi:methionyl-tRNA synthetase
MSKSVGNVIDPNDWVTKYGADAVRYLLLREVAFGQDGDISEEKLKTRYEGDLANGLGNLLGRITNLIEKNLDGKIEVVEAPLKEDEIDRDIVEFKFHDALAKIWHLVIEGNKIVDEYKLWELAKTDINAFRSHCEDVLLRLNSVARYLTPFMPETSKKISDIVNAKKITKAEQLFPRIE